MGTPPPEPGILTASGFSAYRRPPGTQEARESWAAVFSLVSPQALQRENWISPPGQGQLKGTRKACDPSALWGLETATGQRTRCLPGREGTGSGRDGGTAGPHSAVTGWGPEGQRLCKQWPFHSKDQR